MIQDAEVFGSASKSVRRLARILSLILLTIVISGCSVSPETKAEESAWFVLHAIDTAQTANIARTPGVEESESAWAIGREPKRGNVYAYMGSAAALHVGVSTYMDTHHWPRWLMRAFEAVTIADAANCVRGNYQLGIAAHF